MRVLALFITLLVPFQTIAQSTRDGVRGAWETGEAFRAKILYERPFSQPRLTNHSDSAGPILSDEPLKTMEHGLAALRIYSVLEDGSETLALEKIRLYRVFDTGNQSIQRVDIALGPSGSLILRVYNSFIGKDAGRQLVKIIKHEDQIIISNYEHIGGEDLRGHASDGSSILISSPVNCSVDLLTGRRVVDGKEDMIDLTGIVKLEDWSSAIPHELNLCPFE